MTRVPHEALRSTITVEDYVAAGARGPIFGDPRELRASVQFTQRMTTDGYGREIAIDARIIVRPEAGPVPIESRVTYAGRTYRVVREYPYPDDRRPSQWEILVGPWA